MFKIFPEITQKVEELEKISLLQREYPEGEGFECEYTKIQELTEYLLEND